MDSEDLKLGFLKMLDEWKKEKKEGEAQIPRALEILKQKFLYAIGKTEQRPTDEDEELVKQCNKNLYCGLDTLIDMLKPNTSVLWSDKIAHEAVKKILTEHQNFEIGLYLDCAKAVYLNYSGTTTPKLYEALTYVLTHARLFGDQSQNMFQLESNANDSGPKIEVGAVAAPLPNTKYMRKVTQLIEDLRSNYDETKYRILNGNVTYLALLIVRRFVKNSSQFLSAFNRINTHDDYVKLCPHPLDNELPRIDQKFNTSLLENRLQPSAFLAIHAYLSLQDDRSKRILRGTCVLYIEWIGLQMPELFFRVVRLYELAEAQLWDNLCYNQTYKSLFKLAKVYYELHEKSKMSPPTQEAVAWFPYCRALDGKYHADLSAPENKWICMILAYIVDLKIGFDKSHVRDSSWTKKCGMKEGALKVAQAFHKKFAE